MKFIKYASLLVVFFLTHILISSATQFSSGDTLKSPAKNWKEHWFEHDLIVSRTYADANVVFYYDDNMYPSVTWPYKTMSAVWAYVKKTYGAFGTDPRLYVVLHRVVNNKLGGGHPASYFDASHDHHNTIDCGLDDWTGSEGQQIGMPVHEVGHIVSGASHGVKGSPSDALWGDSKFMEIFNYDVLKHIGREDEAGRVYKQMQTQYDDFPRPQSQWFKNWFYPIYHNYGEAAVLNKYFGLLADYFPQKNKEYTRDLNWGEFIHFWSGAAGVNLKTQASVAFGWSDEWEAQFIKAQHDFPQVKYK
ncbi:hypothetical protein J3L18_00675 [Mucilaginibacter gossypii]|uniref:hypothetical protein n=1 Tax=Mucilaginibacter gossypii TaxID=551996 RepID=UPI000DCBBB21|nr:MULTISPECIES: hypothetical protein [Mucilaginibacter]QTE37614.1 hypothetical protein J3L18_00675 [Mucilaginibacter gossypii]RAV58457.1 hypothetical protein DIU36_10145 [Mucilaginibacter rubeus]